MYFKKIEVEDSSEYFIVQYLIGIDRETKNILAVSPNLLSLIEANNENDLIQKISDATKNYQKYMKYAFDRYENIIYELFYDDNRISSKENLEKSLDQLFQEGLVRRDGLFVIVENLEL